jgi:hypothetical protein
MQLPALCIPTLKRVQTKRRIEPTAIEA